MNLLPHHLAELRKSGLSDATLEAAGVCSETSIERVRILLGWPKCPQRLLPGIVFPFTTAEGQNGYCRVRPDHPRKSREKPVKYESPHGKSNEVYVPPGVAAVLQDASRELLLTEGERKALCATQHGFPCIGLVGVFGWKPGKRETLLPALERVAWKGRRVFIAFDNDGEPKPEVQDAESRLAAHLANRGAIMRVVRLPQGEPRPDGKPTKVGLDDFLVGCQTKGLNPAGELRRLLDTAEEPTPPEAGTMKQAASKIDAVPEATRFLATTEREGLPRLRFWRGTWLYWQAGAYREVPPSEIRGGMVEHLDRDFFKLTQGAVGNVLDGLKAKARFPFHIEPPAWIGVNAPEWNLTDVLPCRNGIVHLPSLVSGITPYMLPVTPRLFSLSALDFDFAADAPRPEAWLRFLGELWPNDPNSISTLQDWAGYLLTLDSRQQKILLIIGPKRSGKGTLCRVLTALVGKGNVCGPTLASLGTNFGLSPLVGKTLAVISDARLGGRTDAQVVVERLLSISGEDPLTIDRKNLEPITVKLPVRFVVCSNELPRLGDSSGAIASRMILLRLTTSFYGREDIGLANRLLAEVPSIALWAIEGWRRLRERGRFVQPTAADEMLQELNDLSSPVGAFLRERCNVGPEYEVPRADLYASYSEWAGGKGRKHVEDEVAFGKALRAALPTVGGGQRRKDGERLRVYSGVGLKTDF